MIYEVEVITTAVKRIRVSADSLIDAQHKAKQMEETKTLSDAFHEPVRKEYKAHCKCTRCNKRVDLFYTDNGYGYCIPCYEQLMTGWKAKSKFAV